MPAVRESDETGETLEIVEVRPGVRLWLNARDRAMYAEHERGAKEDNARFVAASRVVAPEAPDIASDLKPADTVKRSPRKS